MVCSSRRCIAPARFAAIGVAVAATLCAANSLAASNLDTGVGGTVTTTGTANSVLVTASDTHITGDLQVGTNTTTITPVTTPGEGSPGFPPYIVNNGDGTSTVFTVTANNESLVTTTATTNTGGVNIDANGNVTTHQGYVTTQVDLLTIDRATAVIIDNGTGLPLPADPRNAVDVAGTFNPLASSFVADGGTLDLGTPVTVPSAGGNLSVAGTGAFAGAVDMGGNQINHLANGTAATDAATVGQVASSVSAEAVVRAAADTTLQNNINSEAASRLLGDTALHKRVDIAEKGVAMAMAMAAIPTVDYGRFSLGIGVGSFKGETAASLGATVMIGDRAKFKVSFANGGGETGGAAGFAMGF